MEIGILGLPQSGKSTLFEIMTGIKSSQMFGEPSVRGVVKVPDARFDRLVGIFKPAKVIPASVPFVDTNVPAEGQWDAIRKVLGAADGLVHIVDGFTAADVAELVKRYRKLADELVISDLVLVESRLEKLAKIPKATMKPEETAQADVLPRAKGELEAGRTLRGLKLSAQELHALKSFAFWTLRPELVVVNCAEGKEAVAGEFSKAAGLSASAIGICCKLEAEIAELAPADRAEFLRSIGVAEPAFEKIIRTAFSLMGRMCFFTVGEDEVRAWVIPAGSTAPHAAAAIHKDFERGFIKAEVVSYDDFIKHGETLAGAKSAGRLRLEGKEYIVGDGDIINFRFNV